MSEGSMIMGTTRGKLGNMVLYRAGGQERQRAYLSRIANPQTDAQSINRMKFRVAGVGYRSLAAASERLKIAAKGTSAYNAFVSKNSKNAPYHYKPFADYCAQNGFSIPAPWQVANGSLTTPTFLQSGNITFGADANAYSTCSFSCAIAKSDIANLGLPTGSVTAKQVLQIVWAALGLSHNIHICSSVGQGINVTTTPYNEYTHHNAMVSNFHDLVEIWPEADIVSSSTIGTLSGDGTLELSDVSFVGSSAIIAGPATTVGSVIYAPVTITASGTDIITLVLHFNDYPTSLFSKVGQFASLWIADGSTNNTSTALLTLSSSLTTEYESLLRDAWLGAVLPSWKTAGSSTNDGVYNG